MRAIVLSLLLIAGMASCHRNSSKKMEKCVSDMDHQNPVSDPDPLPRFSKIIGKEDTLPGKWDTLLTFGRTACFGFCPTFEFVIFSNGVIRYHGIQHIEPLGIVWALMTEEDWDSLVKQVRSAHFLEMADRYPENPQEMLVDLPNVHLSIRWDGQRKSVWDNHSAPEKLKELETLIEEKCLSILRNSKN